MKDKKDTPPKKEGKKAIEQKDPIDDALKDIPIDMYTVSGHSDTITKKTLKRYLDCEKQNIEDVLDYSSRIKEIQKTSGSEKLKLLEELFDVDFLEFKTIFTDLVYMTSMEEKLEWIKLGFQSSNSKVWRCTSFLLPFFFGSDRDEASILIKQKIDQILENNEENNENLACGIETLSFLPEKEQAPIIKKLLVHCNPKVQTYAALTITNLRNDIELIDMCLRSNNIRVQELGINYLEKVNLDDKSKYLEGFNKHLILNVKNNKDDEELILRAFSVIDHLTLDNKMELIKIGIENQYPIVRGRACHFILTMPEDKLKELLMIVTKKLVDIFNNQNFDQEEMDYIVSVITHLPKSLAERIIKSGTAEMIKNKVNTKFIWFLKIIGAKSKKSLIKLEVPQEIIKEFFSNHLYGNYDINDQSFKRQGFEKTGSKTILLGGSLKDKIIVRYIRSQSFLAWRYLYEEHKIWKEYDFDYVPIEPIVSYNLCKDNTVRVFSGVLDTNLNDLVHKTIVYTKELYAQKDKIMAALDQNYIVHGHPHDRNFVVRFFRDKDGNIDLSKTPRLYLIDLDQAGTSYEK